MPETELTPAAREAIRSYMLRSLAIPGVVLTIVAFLLGFLIKDVAWQSAYNEAYQNAASLILKLASEAAVSAENAEQADKDVKKLLEDARNIVAEADTIRGKLRTAQAFQTSEDVVKDIASELIKRRDLEGLITKKLNSRIKRLEYQFSNDVVKNNDKIALRLPAHNNVLLSGSSSPKVGVRSNTQNRQKDEIWKIEIVK